MYWITGTQLQWFKSYLNNRREYTVLRNYESDLEYIT